jgi:hypothetical protein
MPTITIPSKKRKSQPLDTIVASTSTTTTTLNRNDNGSDTMKDGETMSNFDSYDTTSSSSSTKYDETLSGSGDVSFTEPPNRKKQRRSKDTRHINRGSKEQPSSHFSFVSLLPDGNTIEDIIRTERQATTLIKLFYDKTHIDIDTMLTKMRETIGKRELTKNLTNNSKTTLMMLVRVNNTTTNDTLMSCVSSHIMNLIQRVIDSFITTTNQSAAFIDEMDVCVLTARNLIDYVQTQMEADDENMSGYLSPSAYSRPTVVRSLFSAKPKEMAVQKPAALKKEKPKNKLKLKEVKGGGNETPPPRKFKVLDLTLDSDNDKEDIPPAIDETKNHDAYVPLLDNSISPTQKGSLEFCVAPPPTPEDTASQEGVVVTEDTLSVPSTFESPNNVANTEMNDSRNSTSIDIPLYTILMQDSSPMVSDDYSNSDTDIALDDGLTLLLFDDYDVQEPITEDREVTVTPSCTTHTENEHLLLTRTPLYYDRIKDDIDDTFSITMDETFLQNHDNVDSLHVPFSFMDLGDSDHTNGVEHLYSANTISKFPNVLPITTPSDNNDDFVTMMTTNHNSPSHSDIDFFYQDDHLF